MSEAPVYLSEDEIVARILAELSTADVVAIREVRKRSDMIQFHHTAGRHIRNKYSLWSHPNATPDEPDGDNHPDQMSHRILERVWDALHDS